MPEPRFEGSYIAIVTPFRNGEVDEDALRKHIERLLEGGTDGIVPCGTTGEAATLSASEKLQVIKATVEQVNGRVPVVAGSGSNNTQNTVEFSHKVAELGVDGLLVVAPYYNKPNQEGLYQHFVTVADEVKTPVVVYNVPGRSACRIEVPTLARLAEHELIVATKDATGDLVFGSDTLATCGDQLTVLSGDDGTAYPLIAIGGRGTISVVGNVAPRLTSDMCLACREARWTDGRQLHYQILPLFHALFSDANPIPTKAALAMMEHMSDEVRLPLVPLPNDKKKIVRQALVSAGLIGSQGSAG